MELRGKVLIVGDDSSNNSGLFRSLLWMSGFGAAVAFRDDEVLCSLATGPPDVVLFNVDAVTEDHYTLIRMIASDHGSKTAIGVLLSAPISPAFLRSLCGVAEVRYKPLDVQQLLQLVADCMQRRQNGAQKKQQHPPGTSVSHGQIGVLPANPG